MMALATGTPSAAELSPAAAAAFDREAGMLHSRLDDERAGKGPFLWVDGLAAVQQRDTRARLMLGKTVTQSLASPSRAQSLPGALLHHWVATVLVSGTTLDRVVSLMQSYDDYQDIYQPAVRRSRLLAREGDTFRVSLQLFKKKVISVILNTESTVSYLPVSKSRMQVRSVSTRIAEVQDAGQPGEREMSAGKDNGFLWRFNNYCSLDEREEGTYVQCETLSLTRDTPFGLGWLIEPLVKSIPRESLEFTLSAMQTRLRGSGR